MLVEGRLSASDSGNPRIFNRQDGTPSASFEVTANVVRFLSSRDEATEEGDMGPVDSDEIPF